MDGSVGPGGISALAVITKDRKSLLERCLRSFATDFKRSERRLDLAVFDDTSDADARRETRRMLQQLGADSRLSIRYSGLEQKQRYAEELAREADVPLETLAFALGLDQGFGNRVRAGANRNAALLDSAGEAVLLTDDDVIAEPLGVPERTLQLGFSTAASAWEMRFCGDMASAREKLQPVPGILPQHEQLIGARLGACVQRARRPSPWRHSIHHEPAVRITVHGAIGDSGWGSINPFGVLLHHPKLFDHTSPESILGRILQRTVARPTITRGAWFQSMSFGIDNRDLLPPFSPIGRNQDGLFMQQLLTCFEDALVAYLPSAVLHEPENLRRFDGTEFVAAPQRTRCNDLLMIATSLVAGREPRATNGAETLKRIGTSLLELGNLRLPEFRAMLRQSLIVARRQALQRAEQIESSAALSARWNQIFAASRQALNEALQRADYGTPEDLNPNDDAQESWQHARQLLASFGALLSSWPTLVTAAKRLKQTGVRPSTCL